MSRKTKVEGLEPCPFCGGHEIILEHGDNCWYGICSECLAEGGMSALKSTALEAWNCRHNKSLIDANSKHDSLLKSALRHIEKAHGKVIESTSGCSENFEQARKKITEALFVGVHANKLL